MYKAPLVAKNVDEQSIWGGTKSYSIDIVENVVYRPKAST
jgi:hypothetical protein